ncbi:TetR family transcriptional regulator [Nocardiopsis sp. HNM0947]|uniref:TetR family transcriptional regulator n=1 Tax=Nocardiopsis coralli TaxID=2772213 RepID=A0ABR9PDM1_9ACTN|nr:TetR family transcriptional regulator [Nocardiopsis coralli]MBE3001945.1 TetR family transcriptional regulator [Nocardiopsis coralli]
MSDDGAADAPGAASGSSASRGSSTSEAPSTRERILEAAAGILREDGVAARLSVRTVASRAGVSVGSLRHHFPTQQKLRDEVMRRIYDWIVPADRIDDTSLPARDRLVESLRQVLTAAGRGPEAREAMSRMVETFIAAEQTEELREAYLTIERDAQRRIEDWLEVLAQERDQEGDQETALPRDDIPRRARFLSTVVNGLGLERALPAQDSLAQRETETLYAAVDAVLAPSDPREPGEAGSPAT